MAILFDWGSGLRGNLGQNNEVNYSSPVQVGSLTDWAQISSHSMPDNPSAAAIKTDGTLWVWGDNVLGKLGTGDTAHRSSPTQVGSLTNWSFVSEGAYHGAAIKTDGTLWAWGQNNVGALGQNNLTNRSSPVQVGSATNWTKLAAGLGNTGVINSTGELWVTGFNHVGQLGIGSTLSKSILTQVGVLTTWSKIAIGNHGMQAIKTDGTLWGWGYNVDGQVGDGTVTQRNAPVQIGVGTDWSEVSCGYYSVGAIKTDGTLWTWGRNANGQLGSGTTTIRSSPVQVGNGTTWSKISAGSSHMVAIKTDGTIWAWGQNVLGPLGQNDITDRSSPVQVGSATNWTSIVAGQHSTYALRAAAVAKEFALPIEEIETYLVTLAKDRPFQASISETEDISINQLDLIRSLDISINEVEDVIISEDLLTLFGMEIAENETISVERLDKSFELSLEISEVEDSAITMYRTVSFSSLIEETSDLSATANLLTGFNTTIAEFRSQFQSLTLEVGFASTIFEDTVYTIDELLAPRFKYMSMDISETETIDIALAREFPFSLAIAESEDIVINEYLDLQTFSADINEVSDLAYAVDRIRTFEGIIAESEEVTGAVDRVLDLVGNITETEEVTGAVDRVLDLVGNITETEDVILNLTSYENSDFIINESGEIVLTQINRLREFSADISEVEDIQASIDVALYTQFSTTIAETETFSGLQIGRSRPNTGNIVGTRVGQGSSTSTTNWGIGSINLVAGNFYIILINTPVEITSLTKSSGTSTVGTITRYTGNSSTLFTFFALTSGTAVFTVVRGTSIAGTSYWTCDSLTNVINVQLLAQPEGIVRSQVTNLGTSATQVSNNILTKPRYIKDGAWSGMAYRVASTLTQTSPGWSQLGNYSTGPSTQTGYSSTPLFDASWTSSAFSSVGGTYLLELNAGGSPGDMNRAIDLSLPTIDQTETITLARIRRGRPYDFSITEESSYTILAARAKFFNTLIEETSDVSILLGLIKSYNTTISENESIASGEVNRIRGYASLLSEFHTYINKIDRIRAFVDYNAQTSLYELNIARIQRAIQSEFDQTEDINVTLGFFKYLAPLIEEVTGYVIDLDNTTKYPSGFDVTVSFDKWTYQHTIESTTSIDLTQTIDTFSVLASTAINVDFELDWE